MLKVRPLFKFNSLLLAALMFMTAQTTGVAAEHVESKKYHTGLYRDVFDQNIFYEGVNFLHFDRLYRGLFGGVLSSANVNIYDEVPDSIFFTNRHARKKLSSSELEKGYSENNGPETSGKITVIKGKTQGLHPGFFIKDSRGDKYLIKFDSIENFELATSAEVITSRFYHAIGYNVPQYTVAYFDYDQFVVSPEATIYDESGFKKSLTAEKLEEFLLFIPQDGQGRYRASASKILDGKNMGSFSFHDHDEAAPGDEVPHKLRREIRALQVFSSWLNNNDVRESNTLKMLVDENGSPQLKYYLIDFNSSLGAADGGPKPPMFTHEHLFDYGEAFKAFLSLGFWEKPWQERWRLNHKKPHDSAAVGYFNNVGFDAGDFKTQLPHYAFKDLTNADGLWAAKIIMSFSDEDIRAMVKAGKLSDVKDENYVAETLIERRDLIGQYWFSQANALDDFDLSGSQLVFKDLAIDYGFEQSSHTEYVAQVYDVRGTKRGERLVSLTSQSTSFDLGEWLNPSSSLMIFIRTLRSDKKHSPYVVVEIEAQNVSGIRHQV